MTNRPKLKLKIRDFTSEDLARFPDGSYTVGRGADPRVVNVPRTADFKFNMELEEEIAATAPTPRKKPSKTTRAKKAVRPAAE